MPDKPFRTFKLPFKEGKHMQKLERSLGLLLGTLFVLLSPALSLSQAPFYQGKTITIIRGDAAGDGCKAALAAEQYL